MTPFGRLTSLVKIVADFVIGRHRIGLLGFSPFLRLIHLANILEDVLECIGDEIETEGFRKQFVGKIALQMKVLKSATTENIQAISGATISSRAVTEDAVRNALEFLTHANPAKPEFIK